MCFPIKLILKYILGYSTLLPPLSVGSSLVVRHWLRLQSLFTENPGVTWLSCSQVG